MIFNWRNNALDARISRDPLRANSGYGLVTFQIDKTREALWNAIAEQSSRFEEDIF
jgi:hypothetical protein